ncbi:MAG: sigma factor-like helix-turn-helix DNA-binding protein [Kofleriaceae bacterium]
MNADDRDGDFDDEPVTIELPVPVALPTLPAPGEPPAVSRKVRSRRRTRPRSKTIAMRRVTMAELKLGALMYPPVDVARPQTRAECRGEARPCPWVACKHHLYLDINPETGSIKINFPELEPWELQHTCALDVAEQGARTLEQIGEITNLTRERVRQVEVRGLIKLKAYTRVLR